MSVCQRGLDRGTQGNPAGRNREQTVLLGAGVLGGNPGQRDGAWRLEEVQVAGDDSRGFDAGGHT